jgi:hypothetical protein
VDKFFKSVATKLGKSHVRVYDLPREEAEVEGGEGTP